MTTSTHPARPLRRGSPPLPAGRSFDRPGVVWILAVLIVAAGLSAYANGLDGVFVLDDVRAIVRNPTIREVSHALTPPTASTVAGRPVANLSFAASYALVPADARDAFERPADATDTEAERRFRVNSRVFHGVNLAIHLAAALLLFGVVRRSLSAAPVTHLFGASATVVAGVVALLWVVHPLTTAAVAYTVQRVESLMSLWYLLTLYASIRMLQGHRRGAWLLLAVTACAAGMATKETMVTAPVAVGVWLAVFDRQPLDRRRWQLLTLLAATWMVLAVLVWGERRAPSIDLSLLTAWRYLVTQGDVILHYLRLSVWPWPLTFLYDWPLVASATDGILAAGIVAAGAVASVWAVWRRSAAGAAGFFFFLLLAPSSSVLPIVTEVAAEHRMYLPLAVLLAGVVSGTWVGLRRVPGRVTAVTALVVAGVVAVWFGVLTHRRNADYASEIRLWSSSVSSRPGDARARVALGSAYATAGDLAAAEDQLRRAVDLAPLDGIARVRLGTVFARQQKLGAAVQELSAAVVLRPDDVDAHRFLGEVHALRREDAAAVRHLSEALRLKPDDRGVAIGLAAVMADSRDPQVRNAERALALAEPAVRASGGRDPRALEVVAVAYAGLYRWQEAAFAARGAAALARARGEGRRAAALDYRAAAYEEAGRQGLRPR